MKILESVHSPQINHLEQKPIGEVVPSVSINKGLDDKTADTHSQGFVTMQIKNAFNLIDNGEIGLDETDFLFACPYCNEEIEWSGLNYWYCYKCNKKIFREDFKL